jgi:hypothetical protein
MGKEKRRTAAEPQPGTVSANIEDPVESLPNTYVRKILGRFGNEQVPEQDSCLCIHCCSPSALEQGVASLKPRRCKLHPIMSRDAAKAALTQYMSPVQSRVLDVALSLTHGMLTAAAIHDCQGLQQGQMMVPKQLVPKKLCSKSMRND